ncbi:hypothetical protein GOP47_0007321 [Adiantum capillus-veneris]|uniref:Uncharacterized protein n=1 Tax=Adiantum capillus-veneris TaxID=13818 RepID=A0A9D4ZKT3_ADICA|nr:hypothetical protein GOP47_0007321 [Adiantum capillus-veneris]
MDTLEDSRDTGRQLMMWMALLMDSLAYLQNLVLILRLLGVWYPARIRSQPLVRGIYITGYGLIWGIVLGWEHHV